MDGNSRAATDQMQVLRPYQIEAFEAVRAEIRAGKKRIILVAPTGAGKTTLAAHLILSAIKRGSHCIFLARREELIQQCSERLREHGVPHGIIKSGYNLDTTKSVYVASVPTLANRFKHANDAFAAWEPQADIIIPDEGHELTPQTRAVINHYPNAIVVCLTATPARTDGKGLGVDVGGIYESIVQVSSPSELMEMGFLCPYVLFEAPNKIDFSRVKKKGNDFDQTAAARAVDKPDLIGDLYKNWKLRADGKQTIIFAQGREHGKHITEEFRSKGENVVYADAETPTEERATTVRGFKSGKIMILVNVGLYTQGFDAPNCSCVVLGRATMSLILFLQMCGRGFRPAPEKLLVILDHGGNAMRLGFPDDDREWSLLGRKKRAKPAIPSFTKCPPPCGAILRSTTRSCPVCGKTLIVVADRDALPSVADAVLVEAPRDRKAREGREKAIALEEEKKYLEDQYQIQVSRGYNFRYALVRWKERFKDRYNNGKGCYPKAKHGVRVNYEFIGGKHESVSWAYNGVDVMPSEKDLEKMAAARDKDDAAKNDAAFKTGMGL